MGCFASTARDPDMMPPPRSTAGGERVEFGNPLTDASASGSRQMQRSSSWRASTEPTLEDMRRQRILVSSFDAMLMRLKAGRKEHDFVNSLADLALFCDMKEHDVPGNARRLLSDARALLMQNKIRGQFWKKKAEAAYRVAVAKVPATTTLADFTSRDGKVSGRSKNSRRSRDEDSEEEGEEEGSEEGSDEGGVDDSSDDGAEHVHHRAKGKDKDKDKGGRKGHGDGDGIDATAVVVEDGLDDDDD